MKERKKPYFKVMFEISIMIIAIFAFSYIIHESSVVETQGEKVGIFKTILLIITKIFFSEKGMVSALAPSDLTAGSATCIKTNDGKSCQEYPSSECTAKCNVSCIPTSMEKVAECKLGTCFDRAEGTCAVGSPKPTCEQNGGTWFDDPKGNIKECKKGCCVIGSQAIFSTEIRCQRMSSLMGVEKVFKPEVKSELMCYVLSNTQEEGACVLGEDIYSGNKACRFMTKGKCTEVKGAFYGGYLCSNKELNTNCTRQMSVSCVENKDEIYWFDSCGNRENIYSVDVNASWNGGRILPKEQSCALGSADNPVSNRGICGNCNYLLSSRCGNKTTTQRLNDARLNSVCRDLSCIDENGQKRVHGETWCAYQSDIGGGVDTPGARHYRKVCYEGEIRTEPCEEYRNEICVEDKIKIGNGKTISSAACVKNLAAKCLSINSEKDDETKTKECAANPFCMVQIVDISDYFKFNMCVPRHPTGHDLTTGDGGNACSFGTQTCTVVYVKKLNGNRYECEQNCDCEDPEFAEKMNDACMRLGDCGVEANYVGKVTDDGYTAVAKKVSDVGGKDEIKVSGSYKSGLEKYAKVVKGKTSDVDLRKWMAVGEETDTDEDKIDSPLGEDAQDIFMISGLSGATLLGGVWLGYGGGLAGVTGGSLEFSSLFGAVGQGGSVLGTQGGVAAGWGAVGGAAMGAIVGAAIVTLLIMKLGIAPGMSPGLTYGLIAAGAVAGAVMGYSLMASGAATFGAALCAFPPACILFVLIIVFILVMKLMKIGDIKERKVTFTCKQWQPPRGGADCDKCGKDGFKCSKYACESLGQTCKFVNEDTGSERCVDTAPSDVATPVISPWEKVLTSGYRYSNSTNTSELGVYVLNTVQIDGCVPAYSRVTFGIAMDKVGKCKYSALSGVAYKDMTDDFGDSLFKENHSMMMIAPSPEMLGYTSANPQQKIPYNLYVKCENANGVAHERDYAINFCVTPQTDVTPPIIVGKNPPLDYVAGDATEVNTTIYVNEPADCRWDNENREFDLMTGNMTCMNGFEDQTLNGWACIQNLPTPTNETVYYVRCLDKPWLTEETNGSSRNQGEPYKITMKKTPLLEIIYVIPDNQTITSGTQPLTVEVNAETAGGLDGTAECGYSFNGETYFNFYSTFQKTHKQVFEFWEAGMKEVSVKCTDVAGNVDSKNVSFYVDLDVTAPKITKVYQTPGSLTIKTDENAECAISINGCDFSYENASKMSGTGITHTIPVAIKSLYYVKCKDTFGNNNGACDLTIKLL